MWVVTISHCWDDSIRPKLTYFDNSRTLKFALALFIQKDKLLLNKLTNVHHNVSSIVDFLIKEHFFDNGTWRIAVEEIITDKEDVIQLPYEYTH